MNQQRFTEVFNQLTPRRKEVLEKFLAGETDAAIAQSLHIQETTVRKHIEEICRQFALDNDKLPGEHRPKRENLLRLFAKYKPELLSQRDVKDIATEEETAFKSSSVERHEGAIAEPPPENELDKLVEKVRSHSAEVPQPQELAQEETVSKNPDFVGREEAIAEPSPGSELDKLVEKVRSEFRNKIQNKCGTLCLLDDIFDSHWSVSLEQLCINDVKVTDEFDRFASNQGSQTPVHWQERALTKRRLMVRGKPGAGKTTLLQHIAIQCDQAKFRPELLPIFIRLKFFAEDARDADGLSLLDYISQEYCDDSVSKQEVEYLLRHSRALILLDGLDEVPKQDIDEVLKQLRRFLDKPFNNQIIINCRKAAQEYLDNRFQGFTSVEVADFDKEQIKTFAIMWFKAFPGNSPVQGEYQANQFLERLSENHKIQELAGIPLLLHLICFVFQETDDFPSKRSDLYREALNLLLTKWNKFTARNIKLNQDDCDLLIMQLSQIAATTFEQGEFSFKLQRIEQIIKKSESASEDWLKAIEARHGLLVKRGRGTYSFSHQTFQEYLVARKFVSRTEPHDLEKLVSHITEPHWREVFILASEMVPNKGHLLKLMKKKTDELIAKDIYWQYFLTWISQKSHAITAPYKRAAIRAYYLQHGSAIDLSLAYSLDPSLKKRSPELYLDILLSKALHLSLRVSHELDIYSHELNNSTVFTLADFLDDCIQYARAATTNLLQQELQQLISDLPSEVQQILKRRKSWGQPKKLEQLPQIDINNSIERCKEWWQTKGSEWAKRLRLAAAYRDIYLFGYMTYHDELLAENQRGKLYQYYYANRLLVDCLNSPSDVSPEVRSHIEDTLLLPIDEIREIEKHRGIK